MTIFKTRIYYIAQNINRKDLKKVINGKRITKQR